MPKVVSSSSRRLRAQHHHSQGDILPCHPHNTQSPVSHSSILLAAPRKVSFEDGHQSSSSFTSSSSSTFITQSISSCSTSSCSSIASSSSKSSLRRKAPSVCLVGLASSSTSSCLSPMPSQEQHDAPATTPSSPWGHFVDILVPLDEHHHEQQQPAAAKRRLGDSPLFGLTTTSHNDWNDSTATTQLTPTFQPLTKKHKQRSSWTLTSPHPYGLQPRNRRRLRSNSTSSASSTSSSSHQQPSFLPGFFLEGPAPVPLERPADSTKEVEKALQRLQV